MLPAGGAAHLITSASLPGDDTGECPLDERLLVLGFGGRYVGAWVRFGEGSRTACDKYAQPVCPPTIVRLVVTDARSGRHTAALRTGEPLRSGLLLSPGGALAFLDHDARGVVMLHATRLTAVGARALRATPKVIDTGPSCPAPCTWPVCG